MCIRIRGAAVSDLPHAFLVLSSSANYTLRYILPVDRQPLLVSGPLVWSVLKANGSIGDFSPLSRCISSVPLAVLSAHLGIPKPPTFCLLAKMGSTICMYLLDVVLLFFTTTYRYLHLGFRASSSIMNRQSIALVWSILRIRHPLLASQVEMHDYNDIRFVYVSSCASDDSFFI